MKPIPTLRKGLPSLSFPGYEAEAAHYERSDVCAVPAASVVVRAMVSFVLARSLLQKFGGDTLHDTKAALERYRQDCLRQSKTPDKTIVAAGVPEMELE
jgi:chorismate synthase